MAETKPKMEASLEDECHSASAASAAAPIIFRRSFQRRNSVSELLAEDKRENEKSHVMACVSICESNDASARPIGHPLVLTHCCCIRPTSAPCAATVARSRNMRRAASPPSSPSASASCSRRNSPRRWWSMAGRVRSIGSPPLCVTAGRDSPDPVYGFGLLPTTCFPQP